MKMTQQIKNLVDYSMQVLMANVMFGNDVQDVCKGLTNQIFDKLMDTAQQMRESHMMGKGIEHLIGGSGNVLEEAGNAAKQYMMELSVEELAQAINEYPINMNGRHVYASIEININENGPVYTACYRKPDGKHSIYLVSDDTRDLVRQIKDKWEGRQ